MEDLVKSLELAESSKGGDSKVGSKVARSVYKGVYKCGNKFKAQIQISRVQHYLGLFDDELQAALAYDNHARIILGDKARTNFDGSGSVFAPVPLVPITEPLRQEKLKSEHHAVESKVRESTKSRKRLYIGINQRPVRFTSTPSAGTAAIPLMGREEMEDSAALLGQLRTHSGSDPDIQDPTARPFPSTQSSSYSQPQGHLDPPAHRAQFADFPAYFHPGFPYPAAMFHKNNNPLSTNPPPTIHMHPSSQFHEHFASAPSSHPNSTSFAPPAPPAHHGSTEAQSSSAFGPDDRSVSKDLSSSGSGKSYSTKTSTESMLSDDQLVNGAGASPVSTGKASSAVPAKTAVSPPARASLDRRVTHWAGLLQHDPHRPGHIQIWRGTWVVDNSSSLSAFPFLKPAPAAFAQSPNHFEYVCEMRFVVDSSGQNLIPVSGMMRGVYSHGASQNNGISAQTGQDRELFVEFAPSSVPHRYTATGCGDGEAGEFVVTGQFSAISCVLELTRQYISR